MCSATLCTFVGKFSCEREGASKNIDKVEMHVVTEFRMHNVWLFSQNVLSCLVLTVQ